MGRKITIKILKLNPDYEQNEFHVAKTQHMKIFEHRLFIAFWAKHVIMIKIY